MGHLGFDVRVEVATGETSRLNVVADGDEKEALGALIGRKGERLSALQHLVNLMLSKEIGTWTRVLVDVEDYRGRRERQLRECRPSSVAGSTSRCGTIRRSRRSRSARSRTGASCSSRGRPADGSRSDRSALAAGDPAVDRVVLDVVLVELDAEARSVGQLVAAAVDAAGHVR